MSSSQRLNRILEGIRCAELQTAIQRAKSICCSPRATSSAFDVPPESAREAQRGDVTQWNVVFPTATVVRGKLPVRESSRIQELQFCTIQAATDISNPETRFSMYRRPYLPPVCTPVPAEALSANLPKTSTKPICSIQRFEGVILPPCDS